MTQQLFLNEEQIFDLLLEGIPDGVYPQDRADNTTDPDKNSTSAAELRAQARILALAYANLADIYGNKFITTVLLDGLAPWEKELFSAAQDSSQSFAVRQQNLLIKVRSYGGISMPAIQRVIATILTPLGIDFEIWPWNGATTSNGHTGAWLFEISEFEEDTFLTGVDPLLGARQDVGYTPLDCSLDYAAAGISADDLAEIQSTAYTYEVRIYGNADAATLTRIDSQLTVLEGAARTHVITNNATPPDA